METLRVFLPGFCRSGMAMLKFRSRWFVFFMYTGLLVVGESPGSAVMAQSCLYRESRGTQVKEFQWHHRSSALEELVTVQEEGADFVNHGDRSGQTLAYHFRQGMDTDIHVRRESNLLQVSGILRGKKVERTESIDDRPWYQPLSFSLREFLKTDERRRSFWMIRNDTLELVTIQAEKRGVEEVLVSGRRVMARRVEIRKTGFFASLWHGDYWFRMEDDLFVRYQAVHGPPGTPETVVQLIRELPEH